ncbi:MAG TPA: class I SAM-dependent methyltransferase [Rhodanobacteraceae bacterium]|jgi:SAM-dependent methyltransferase|nr:class I SAM-dependent methyltransferase [Rhodanobacteraceae bacterium]
MSTFARLRYGFGLVRRSAVAFALRRCPYCGPSVFIWFGPDATDVRCVGCSAGIVQLGIGWALRDNLGPLGKCDVCELSSRGALVAYLRRKARSVTTSEYLPGVAPGTLQDGVRCEDVQRLTYENASFDLVTHTEVLEHVPDDARAIGELLRVLRPGGAMIFTVPMHEGERTIERARQHDGAIEYLLEPVYHLDLLRPEGILAFRDYGRDIVERLRVAGFVDVRILAPSRRLAWLGGLPVIAARKPS